MSTRNPLVVEVTDRLGPALSAELVARLHDAGYSDLRLAHGNVFEHIAEGARLTVLAERAQMTKQSMGELVVDLEHKGYVQRSPDPGDGRAVIISCTRRGRQVVDHARRNIADLHAFATAQLGAGRMGELEALLVEYEAAFEAWRSRDA